MINDFSAPGVGAPGPGLRLTASMHRGAVMLIAALIATVTAVQVAPAEPSPEPARKPKTVGILMFEGVELMDFAGPAEVFLLAGQCKAFRVVTVAESTQPLKTMGGITVVPDYTFENAPPVAVLVVPGGNLKAVGKAGRHWLKQASASAEITLSVCFGALLLADAGLLDGIEATTHHWGLRDLQTAAPNCRVVSNQRFVEAGKIISTAGVASGVDGALQVVKRLLGEEAEKWVAEEWMEHRRPVPPAP